MNGEYKGLLFFVAVLWLIEEDTPFVTRSWPEWKRRVVFLKPVGKMIDAILFICERM